MVVVFVLGRNVPHLRVGEGIVPSDGVIERGSVVAPYPGVVLCRHQDSFCFLAETDESVVSYHQGVVER